MVLVLVLVVLFCDATIATPSAAAPSVKDVADNAARPPTGVSAAPVVTPGMVLLATEKVPDPVLVKVAVCPFADKVKPPFG